MCGAALNSPNQHALWNSIEIRDTRKLCFYPRDYPQTPVITRGVQHGGTASLLCFNSVIDDVFRNAFQNVTDSGFEFYLETGP